jgi:predicted nucleic-acid-binding Zn-ribbon protein
MKDGVCPKCGERKVVPELQILDNISLKETYVSLEATPDAALFKNRQYAPLRAWLCGNCGYAELYCSNFKYLVKAHERLQQKRAGSE